MVRDADPWSQGTVLQVGTSVRTNPSPAGMTKYKNDCLTSAGAMVLLRVDERLYGSFKLICSFNVLTSSGFAYCSELFVNGIEAQNRAAGRIVEVR